jgi:VanZ family protein
MVRTGAPGELEHVAAYLISALLWVTAYQRWSPWVIGSALAICAGVLEVGQIYVPGRHSQFESFAASCLGVAVVVPASLSPRSGWQAGCRAPILKAVRHGGFHL